jgi:hypothetical protein
MLPLRNSLAMHDHEHADHGCDGDPPPSTGFLPISLAIGLFVTGLFALGIIPGLSCGPKDATSTSPP